MKIVVASDHRGFEKKQWIVPLLQEWGHAVVDVGCGSSASCDYPDFAEPAAAEVANGVAELGIFLDNSGIGMCLAANKVRGVRAAIVLDLVAAKLCREANHCNVLCLGCDLLSDAIIEKIVREFIATPAGGGRHERRMKKIADMEARRFR
jgi:ribose 5-phosphate isomerase B